MQTINIYTDGACSVNTGIGGIGIVICLKDRVIKNNARFENTTNNRMEILAVCQAVNLCMFESFYDKEIERDSKLIIHTDSSYVSNAFNKGWLDNWVKNGWKTANNKDVKNKDLWQHLLNYLDKVYFDIELKWVKAHCGNTFNELADKLAVDGKENRIIGEFNSAMGNYVL